MENSETKTVKRRSVRTAKSENKVKIVSVEAIRQKAFEIYLNSGGNSNELDNWIKAERELKNGLK